MTLNCRSCNLSDIRRSRRRFFDYALSLVRIYPYRCEVCDKRQYIFGAR